MLIDTMLRMGTLEGTPLGVAPLCAESLDGKLYTRRAEITAKLKELLRMPRSEQVARCEIDNVNDENFVPPECVVYLVRSFRSMPESSEFERLYKNLLLKRLVPRRRAAICSRLSATADASMLVA